MQSKKLLLVIDSLGSGGAQRQLANLAMGLKKRSYEVEIFTYYSGDFFLKDIQALKIPVHRSLKNSRFSLAPLFSLRKLIKKNSFTHVVSFLETPSIYSELATLDSPHIRLITSERSSHLNEEPTMMQRIKATLHRRADTIIPNSYFHASWMQKAFPFLAKKIKVIQNGIDITKFTPPRTKRTLDSNVLRLIGIGRITDAKNLSTLIEALKLVRESGLNVSIDWAGRFESEHLKQEFDSLLNEYNLFPHWRWLGEVQDISHLLQGDYNASILASRWEGFPNAVCEALAVGLPVIASNVSDIPKIIEHGKTGFLFNPTDADHIKDSIIAFSKLGPLEIEKMSILARQHCEAHLSLENMVTAFEETIFQ